MNIEVYVRPSQEQCRFCLNMQEDYNQIEDCNTCYKNKRYIMIGTNSNITGTYAVVKNEESKLESVSIYRIEVIEK